MPRNAESRRRGHRNLILTRSQTTHGPHAKSLPASIGTQGTATVTAILIQIGCSQIAEVEITVVMNLWTLVHPLDRLKLIVHQVAHATDRQDLSVIFDLIAVGAYSKFITMYIFDSS